MNNFRNGSPGGARKRPEFMGGRPKSDANYGPKKSFDKKPSFGGNRGGFDRGGDRGGFNKSRDGERREVTMHKATCSTCGKPCEVPFRPDGSKPVLCSECFGKNRSDDRNGVERRDRFSNDRPKRSFDTPRPERGQNPELKGLQQQVTALEAKVLEILAILKASPVKKVAQVKKSEEVVIPFGETVTVVSDIKKTPAKKAAAKKSVVAKAVKKPAAKKVATKKVVKKATKK